MALVILSLIYKKKIIVRIFNVVSNFIQRIYLQSVSYQLDVKRVKYLNG